MALLDTLTPQKADIWEKSVGLMSSLFFITCLKYSLGKGTLEFYEQNFLISNIFCQFSVGEFYINLTFKH